MLNLFSPLLKPMRATWQQQRWRRNVAIAGIVAVGVLGLRAAGLLEAIELSTFDLWMRVRPQPGRDPRVVIVGFDEQDIDALNWPIADRDLAQVLQNIHAQGPLAIGLDVYRDIPVREGQAELETAMREIPNLFGIQKVVSSFGDEMDELAAIDPPPALAELGQVGANDLPIDNDGRVRRGFIYLDDSQGNTVFSLAFLLAWRYLEQTAGITPENVPHDPDLIQLGAAQFTPLSPNSGGYSRADAAGYQIFLNYRAPQKSYQVVPLRDVLAGNIEPGIFRDRIVLIGSLAVSLKDYSLTPYSNNLRVVRDSEQTLIPKLRYVTEFMAGVEIHANLTSFLIDAALGDRDLIRTLPEAWEWGLIVLCSVLGATGVARWNTIDGLDHLRFKRTLAGFLGWQVLLLSGAYVAFALYSWWLPLAPLSLALSSAAIAKVGGTLIERLLLSYRKIEEYARTLEIKVEQRTEELRDKNTELEHTLTQLQMAQQQIIAQERLASLGSLTAGVAHEIRNPLNFVNNFSRIAVELTAELDEELTDASLTSATKKAITSIFEDFQDCMATIRQNGQRIEQIVDSMLSHTHAEGGKPITTDVQMILQEAVELVYHNAQAKYPELAVTLTRDYQAAIAPVECIPQNLSKALINILTNSWEAMARRDAATPLEADYFPHLQIHSHTSDTELHITIRDNGDGMTPDVQAKMFDPFFTTKPTGEGTGLGLSLAHQAIVSGTQGAIAVDSQPQNYTELRITLPLDTTIQPESLTLEPEPEELTAEVAALTTDEPPPANLRPRDLPLPVAIREDMY